MKSIFVVCLSSLVSLYVAVSNPRCHLANRFKLTSHCVAHRPHYWILSPKWKARNALQRRASQRRTMRHSYREHAWSHVSEILTCWPFLRYDRVVYTQTDTCSSHTLPYWPRSGVKCRCTAMSNVWCLFDSGSSGAQAVVYSLSTASEHPWVSFSGACPYFIYFFSDI